MTIKVVFNAVYGGFSISMKCAELMASMGCLEAQRMLEAYEDDGICQWWTGQWEGPRHDPLLVEAVEKLGYLAGESWEGDPPQHEVYTLIYGTKYIIEEYDGRERVVEPDDINWINARPPRQLPTGEALSMELKI